MVLCATAPRAVPGEMVVRGVGERRSKKRWVIVGAYHLKMCGVRFRGGACCYMSRVCQKLTAWCEILNVAACE